MNPNTSSTPTLHNRSGLVAGAILIVIGILNLVAQYVNPVGWMFFGALALIFLTAGLIARQNGLVIPGGIIAGLALGVSLVEGPFKAAGEPYKGGTFILALAAGWVLVMLASLLVHALNPAQSRMFWPLIPAAGLAFFGGALLTNNLRTLELAGQGWPVILIIIGLYLVLRRRAIQS